MLALPASAAGATRYATPTPAPESDCSQADPCALDTAIGMANALDVVEIAPGDYDVTTDGLTINQSIVMKGRDGSARPRLFTNGSVPTIGFGVSLLGPATLQHLRVEQNNPSGGHPAIDARNAPAVTMADLEVVASSPGAPATGIELGTGALTGSTVRAVGAPGVAINAEGPGPSVIQNVTAWGSDTAGGAGIRSGAGLPVLTIRNVIAHGETDLLDGSGMGAAGFGSPLTSSYSSASPGIPAATVGPAALANPSAGDFHQLRNSPTVDAGTLDPLAGLTDIDSQARVLRNAIDVGADEYLPRPPGLLTGDPTGVSSSGATLTGTVDPEGAPTSYRFEYGPTTGYGSSTPLQDAGSSEDPVQVGAVLDGLTPGSVLHYRLIASNVDGDSIGLDRVLILAGEVAGSTIPHFTSLSAPMTATVGVPIEIRAGGSDPNGPVNGISIDFSEPPGGLFAESACRLRPPDAVFGDGRTNTFTVPYTFTRPGPHTVSVTLQSAGCGRAVETVTQTIDINVAPAGTSSRVRARRGVEAVTITAASCKGSGLVPNARNRKRVETATRCLLNKIRRQFKRKRLRHNKKLRKAAAVHNTNMARGGFFAHQGPGEPALGARLKSVRYRGGGGENLGLGSYTLASPKSMVAAWMASPVHRANILQPKFRTIGIAVIPQKPLAPPKPGATYTANFGTTKK